MVVTLKDVCLGITDGEHNTVIDDKEGEYFLLSSKNIKNGSIVFGAEERKINHEILNTLNKRTKMMPGDVVISTIGTIGESAIVGTEINFEFQRSVGILKPDTSKITSKFLYYLTKTKGFKDEASRFTSGSVQECLFIGALEKIKINEYSIDEQNRIVSKLWPIDERIKQNEKAIEHLLEYSQLIYYKWFIDFNFPNKSGKPYKINDGKMVEVGDKVVPEGWEIVKYSDIATFKNGINYEANKELKPNSKIISVKQLVRYDVINDDFADSLYIKEGNLEEFKIKAFDSIIARSASPGEVAIALTDLDSYYSGFSIRARPNDFLWRYIVYFNALKMKKIITSHSDGTIIKNITQQSLTNFKLTKPSSDVASSFNSTVEPILGLVDSLQKENRILEQTRDLLIKKLIR
jgi:type I restriction enzyme S subunit